MCGDDRRKTRDNGRLERGDQGRSGVADVGRMKGREARGTPLAALRMPTNTAMPDLPLPRRDNKNGVTGLNPETPSFQQVTSMSPTGFEPLDWQ